MTCTPPRDTKPGTLCVLRRDRAVCVGRWDGLCYAFHRPSGDVSRGTLIGHHLPAPGGCRCGWVFAGVMPEPMQTENPHV